MVRSLSPTTSSIATNRDGANSTVAEGDSKQYTRGNPARRHDGGAVGGPMILVAVVERMRVHDVGTDPAHVFFDAPHRRAVRLELGVRQIFEPQGGAERIGGTRRLLRPKPSVPASLARREGEHVHLVALLGMGAEDPARADLDVVGVGADGQHHLGLGGAVATLLTGTLHEHFDPLEHSARRRGPPRSRRPWPA